MAHSTDKDVPLNLLKIVRKAKGVTMTQAQDPSKVTKETASFSELKEILKTWMMQHSGFSGNKELTSFLQEADRELRACYRDWLSVAGTEVSLLSGL